MDELGVERAAVVGWSDGAIIGLQLALSHPRRISRLFAFGVIGDLSGLNDFDGCKPFRVAAAAARIQPGGADVSEVEA
jgi:pimeloyl-ACP methyl ester carboxylesterase